MSVRNNSAHPIYVKPENGSGLIKVNPGETYNGEHDGVAVPHQKPGKVYKTVDNVDATVNENGDVEYSSNDLRGMVGQPVRGGWLDSAPDSSWNEIFTESNRVQQEREVRERAEREARARAESERAERERREREERERRERHEREIRGIRERPINERSHEDIDRDQYEIREREERDRTA